MTAFVSAQSCDTLTQLLQLHGLNDTSMLHCIAAGKRQHGAPEHLKITCCAALNPLMAVPLSVGTPGQGPAPAEQQAARHD